MDETSAEIKPFTSKKNISRTKNSVKIKEQLSIVLLLCRHLVQLNARMRD